MDTVKNWKEIIDNLRQFSYVTKQEDTFTFDKFSQFYHWYYFPYEEAFAPSKFLGYKNTTIKDYSGRGWGGITQNTLLKYFDKVPFGSKEFKALYQKLEDFAHSLGKPLSIRILKGSGGIYTPKKEFNKNADYSQKIFDVVSNDLTSIESESTLEGKEGAKTVKLVNIYERIPALRAKAIQIHGLICKVCSFDFKKSYGSHGADFIEVHHLKPLYTLADASLINPATDMTVLCSNCHRMIHRKKDNPLTIEQLKEIWNKNNS